MGHSMMTMLAALAAMLLMGTQWTSAIVCHSKSKGNNLLKAGERLASKADRLKGYGNLSGAANVASASARKYRVAAVCFASIGKCEKAASAATSSEQSAQKAADIAKNAPSYYYGIKGAVYRAKGLAKAARRSADGYGCKDN